jgi:PAS domain S-box-containing protein
MSETTKQNYVNSERDESAEANLYHYLRWPTAKSDIVHVEVYAATDADDISFPPPEKLKSTAEEVSDIFRHPMWKDIKVRVDESGRDVDLSVFIRYRDAFIHGRAESWKDDDYYYSKIVQYPQNPNEGLSKHSPIGECISTSSGQFLVVNEKLADIYGYGSVEEMLAIPDIAQAVYYKPDDRNRLVQMIEAAKGRTQATKLNFQFIGRKKNEELVIISKNVLPHFYKGKTIYLYGYVEDITEVSDDIESLDLVFKCDLDGERIIYANSLMTSALGYSRDRLRKMDPSEIFSEESLWKSCLQQLRKNRKIQDISVVISREDGSTKEFFLNLAIVTAKNGQDKDDIYLRGSLVSKLGKPVRKILIDELKASLSDPKYGLSLDVQKWSITAAHEIAGEFTIDHFSDGELSQFIQNIVLVCDHHKSQSSSRLEFLPNLSLQEKIHLDVINSLRFFNSRSELLKDAFTLTQLAALDFSKEDAIERIQKKLLLAIDKEGEWFFPSWQFDINSPEKVIDKLPQVLEVLNEAPITQLSWLMNPHDAFDGKKPYQVLKEGTEKEKQKVVAEASGVGGW